MNPPSIGALVEKAFKAIPAGMKGAVVVSRVTQRINTYNPTTDVRGGDGGSSFTAANAVIAPVPADEIRGTDLVAARVRAITLPAAECTFPPDVGMTVTWGGFTWGVFAADPVTPDGANAIVYELRVKR